MTTAQVLIPVDNIPELMSASVRDIERRESRLENQRAST
jgi:hypothetical protein